MSTVFAGNLVRASDVRTASGIYVRKTAAESVTSSATLQNDDELFLAVEASRFYDFVAFLKYDGATAGDIKFAWTGPSGFTIRYRHTGAATGLAGTSGDIDYREITEADTLGVGANGAATTLICRMEGIVTTSATAGTLQLQWAQFASSATATRVFAGSFLYLRDMGL